MSEVTIRTKREDPNAGAKFVINDVDDVAGANEEICGPESVDAGKLDARFEVELDIGRKERVYIGESRT